MNIETVPSPFGTLGIVEEDGHITQLLWDTGEAHADTPLLREAARQLRAYLDSTLDAFDLPLAPRGSDFEHKVWAAMRAIPRGETRTYGDIAKDLGVPAQPVGQACGTNPIPIIIPCHRVVGGSGLGGFSGCGGVETKVKLLRHERAYGLLL